MFYSLVKPALFAKPEMYLLNHPLSGALDVSTKNPDDFITLFFSEESHKNIKSFAQAYAGHQFGFFTRLGDGRAIILGEHITESNHRFDIQLKGSGRTIYSRGGDGRATLKSMLREYLISEAMYFLNILTSRSLAVIKTNQPVYRETVQEGGILVRVMQSHIRVGTFEYAAHLGRPDDLRALTDYTIKRLYLDIQQEENPAVSLLYKVINRQIESVVHWMRVGFIHGVMNTDNTSISGETFDYGPCAFMNIYDPAMVYSSIDGNGRYSFGNQPGIIKWNIARFVEALLPILHPDSRISLELATEAMNEFDTIWKEKYYGMMLTKIGLKSGQPGQNILVDELLDLMKNLKMDYTNTFWDLSQEKIPEKSPIHRPGFKPWLEKWKHAIENSSNMQRQNSG